VIPSKFCQDLWHQ